MIYVFGIILLLMVICSCVVYLKYSKLIDIKDAIEISSNKIEDILKRKHEVVNSLLENVEDKKIKSKFKYNNDDSLIDREDSIFDVSFNINKYFKDNSKKVNKDIKLKIHELNDIEEELDGLKDFYNANVLDYNELFLNKLLNKIFRYLKFGDYKSFKIRKLEEYEIFKN